MDVRPSGAPGRLDDPESSDATPLDVTPRTGPADNRSSGSRRNRTIVAIAALSIIVLGLGAVLFNGLKDASLFFYNVDEALAKQPQLEGKRFRIQGNVEPGSLHKTSDGVDFVLKYNGKSVDVVHKGDPPELFGTKIPVVLEGTFKGDTYDSDTILIRHDNNYDEKNPKRVRAAEKDANSANGPETTTTTGSASG